MGELIENLSINSPFVFSWKLPMSRKSLRRTIFFVLIGMLSGCGTTRNMLGLRYEIVPPLYPFGGTAIDVACALEGPGDEGIGLVMAMDTPFSIVGDIVMLPITVPYTCMARFADYDRDRSESEPTHHGQSLEIDDD
jgi:hypothetical protein